MTILIQRFGPLGVFMLMIPESAGIPLPSEVTLLFSGFAVSQHWMSLWLAILAATAGNVVGSLIAYGIGASGLLSRVPGATRVLKHSEQMIERNPLKAVFIARLLPLARTFVSLPAGARHVPVVPFIALTTAGCALWATGLVLVGVVSGHAWAAVDSVLGKALVAIGAVVGIGYASRRLARLR